VQFGEVLNVKLCVPPTIGVPVANRLKFIEVPTKFKVLAKVTPFTVIDMLQLPSVVIVAVISCVTPDTAVPATIVPAEVVVQAQLETTAVPLELGWITTLEKLQFDVVFKVKLYVPEAIGVPEAVRTMDCEPVPAKVPLPENVTPLAVAEIL
jgi:hypothetical protein